MEILDIQESIDLKLKVSELLKNNSDFIKHIVFNVGSLTLISDQILEAILENKKLFKSIVKKMTVSTTLTKDTTVFIQNLKLWATPKNEDSLYSFVMMKSILMYEIILNNSKIVLMCDNTKNIIEKINQIIKKHFGIYPRYEDSESNFIQILLPNTLGTSLDVLNTIRKDLLLENRMLVDYIYLDTVYTSNNLEYNKAPLGKSSEFNKVGNLESFSAYMSSIIINYGNQTINYGEKPKTVYDKEKILTWIADHPPGDSTKLKYYEEFMKSNVCKISMNKFSLIMMDLGYETSKHNKCRKWVRD
jgi:hypothetical protein